jgi:hypothetical protein
MFSFYTFLEFILEKCEKYVAAMKKKEKYENYKNSRKEGSMVKKGKSRKV